MQVKRFAVPVLVALSLAACSSDSSTGPGGTSDAQRQAAYTKFNAAASSAGAAGASNAAVGFSLVSMASVFGSGTSTVTMSSNGLASLVAADSKPVFATAGSYQAFALSLRSISNYGSSADTSEENIIVAYKDTTDLVIANVNGTGSFDTGDAFGAIYHNNPVSEWMATSGTASLTNMQLGGSCSISTAMRQIIEAEIGGSGTTWSCNAATFNAAVDITQSEPSYFDSGTNNATGSRTASFSRNGLPGLRITITDTYTR